jgi:hypothetical protein
MIMGDRSNRIEVDGIDTFVHMHVSLRMCLSLSSDSCYTNSSSLSSQPLDMRPLKLQDSAAP